MTNQNNPSEDPLTQELRKLGKNINQFAKTAWKSPERQQIQSELESHLNEIGDTLNQAAHDFSESPRGQQFQNEINDFGRRLSNGEIEAKIQQEMTSLIGKINAQIEKTSERWESDSSSNHQSGS